MKVNPSGFFFMAFLSLCFMTNAQETVDFFIVANGTNVGFCFCSNNHVIENDTALSAFCDSINLNPQILNYKPNFDSVQLIGIAYQQGPNGAYQKIQTISKDKGTVWVEITYSTVEIPPGIEPWPGYKYEIVAIPRQSNPIAFKLVPSTKVAFSNNFKNNGLLKAKIQPDQAFDLLGRQVIYCARRGPSALRIIRNETHPIKALSLFAKNK